VVDDEVTMAGPVTRIGWRLVDAASYLLDAPERDVVRGDLAECGADPGRALYEILGLVVRRQAAAWLDWRPWFAVMTIVIPIGFVLSHASRYWGARTAVDVINYWTLWDFAYLGYPGWRRDVIGIVGYRGFQCLALAGWAWTAGFVLSRLSRRTMWVTVTMLCFVLILGTLGAVTSAQVRATQTLQGHVVWLVVPRLLRTFLVMLPAVWGAQRGRRLTPLPFVQAAVGVLLLVTVTALASRGTEGALVFGGGLIRPEPGPDGFIGSEDDPRPLWFVSFVMIWPALYVLASASWHRLQGRRAIA
jgi:hypothetical protein